MAIRTKISQVKGVFASTKGFRGVLATAIMFDMLSAIPFLGVIFSGLGYGTIWIWLKTKDADPSLFSGDTKKLASTAAEFIGGMLGLGIVPGITFWAYFAIVEYKQKEQEEQEAEIQAMKETQKKLAHRQKRRAEQINNANQQRVKRSAYQ